MPDDFQVTNGNPTAQSSRRNLGLSIGQMRNVCAFWKLESGRRMTNQNDLCLVSSDALYSE
jgi:hypothetical protein